MKTTRRPRRTKWQCHFPLALSKVKIISFKTGSIYSNLWMPISQSGCEIGIHRCPVTPQTTAWLWNRGSQICAKHAKLSRLKTYRNLTRLAQLGEKLQPESKPHRWIQGSVRIPFAAGFGISLAEQIHRTHDSSSKIGDKVS